MGEALGIGRNQGPGRDDRGCRRDGEGGEGHARRLGKDRGRLRDGDRARRRGGGQGRDRRRRRGRAPRGELVSCTSSRARTRNLEDALPIGKATTVKA